MFTLKRFVCCHAFRSRVIDLSCILCIQILAEAKPKYDELTAAAAQSLQAGPYPVVIDKVKAAAQLCR